MFNILHQRWKEFDDKIGQYDEDRTDYEPYVHKSKRALAIELGLINSNSNESIYKPTYFQQFISK